MEVKKNRDVIISNIQMVTLIIVTLFSAFSCKSTDVEGNLNPDGQIAVNVMLEDDVFDQTLSMGSKSSANKSAGITVPAVQTSTVAFNEDYYLVTELTEEVPKIAQKDAKASLQKGNKAAQTSNLKPNIKYKVVVYKNTGEYVIEKDYARGQETSTGPVLLTNGKYIFVVYSINSTSVLPAVTFSDPVNKTLAGSSVALTGNQDLMYFRKDMTLSAASTNYLGVVLKHKFSQITTTIDATATGYNITAITSAINPEHRPNATMTLSDGILTSGGTATSVAVTFPTLGAQTITATPTLINAATITTGSYTISSITAGPLLKKNITPFNDLVITPGVKYNMKVKLVPLADGYLIHAGLPAVRFRGQIWMRHNVGANTSADPDALTSAIHGNYYQWGRIAVVGTGTSTSITSWWDIFAPPAGSPWNTNGDGVAPPKTSVDPCPAGYRIPTSYDFSILIMDAVNVTDVGTPTDSPTNYAYAKVLTSRKNSSIKMTLPGQGWIYTKSTKQPYTPTTIAERGIYGSYWTSSMNGGINNGAAESYGFRPNSDLNWESVGSPNVGSLILTKVVARNIRCVAE